MSIITIDTEDLTRSVKRGTKIEIKLYHRSRPLEQGASWSPEPIGVNDSFVLIFKKKENKKRKELFKLKAGGTVSGAYSMAESAECSIDFTENSYTFIIPVDSTDKLAPLEYLHDVEWFPDDTYANKTEIFSNITFRLYD